MGQAVIDAKAHGDIGDGQWRRYRDGNHFVRLIAGIESPCHRSRVVGRLHQHEDFVGKIGAGFLSGRYQPAIHTDQKGTIGAGASTMVGQDRTDRLGVHGRHGLLEPEIRCQHANRCSQLVITAAHELVEDRGAYVETILGTVTDVTIGGNKNGHQRSDLGQGHQRCNQGQDLETKAAH